MACLELAAPEQAAFERYVVHASRRVPRGRLKARVDFTKLHALLLLIAGAKDHLIPASLVKSNHDRYRHSPSETDLKEFAGRAHFIIGQKNWEEVADTCLEWLNDKVV